MMMKKLLVGSARVWSYAAGRLLFFGYLLYFPVSQQALSVFRCESVRSPSGMDLASYVSAAPWMACHFSRHRAMVSVAVIMTVAFVVGLPAFLLWRLRERHEQLDKPKVEERLGFLYFPYKSSHEDRDRHWQWAWELGVVGFRNLAIAVLLAATSFGSPALPVCVLLVLIAALVLHVPVRPYREPLDSWLEGVSLFVSIALYLSASLNADGGGSLAVVWSLSRAVAASVLAWRLVSGH